MTPVVSRTASMPQGGPPAETKENGLRSSRLTRSRVHRQEWRWRLKRRGTADRRRQATLHTGRPRQLCLADSRRRQGLSGKQRREGDDRFRRAAMEAAVLNRFWRRDLRYASNWRRQTVHSHNRSPVLLWKVSSPLARAALARSWGFAAKSFVFDECADR